MEPLTVGHGDLCKLYRAKHDSVPPKRLHFVVGAERLVNAETEAERDRFVRAVEAVMSPD